MVMTRTADLELTIQPWTDHDWFSLDMRLVLPDGADEKAPLGDKAPILVQLDFEALAEVMLQPLTYGQRLTASVFKDQATLDGLHMARLAADANSAALRVRLNLGGGPYSPLHNVCWETLFDPDDQVPLAASQSVFFSRFLGSGDLRPVRLRSRSEMRVLAAIANPASLEEKYQLPRIDRDKENELLTSALGDLSVTKLEPPVSLNRICAMLDGVDRFDVLYLVCHGSFQDEMSYLWLETDEQQVARVSGSEFALRMHDLQQRPNLVVLASCQSAGSQQGRALSAVAPRLARGGIPAVLAMQEKIEVETSRKFMEAFFGQLRDHNQIDQAVAAARLAIRDRNDWWVPMLLMRLRTGAIWFLQNERQTFRMWPSLLNALRDRRCTPIIGSGVIDSMVGSAREIAQSLAEQFDFPFHEHESEDLAQVLQYLANQQDEGFARRARDETMRRFILRAYASDLDGDVRARSLRDLQHMALQRRNGSRPEPHKVLAQLPCKIYITANPDDLLITALQQTPASRGDRRKQPIRDHTPWTQSTYAVDELDPETPASRKKGFRPTIDEPLVYHLFGRDDVADSQVVTGANYLDYLIAVSGDRDRIPSAVWTALAQDNLLFIGFDIDDWPLRILMQSILNTPGAMRAPKRANIAVQIDPDARSISDPERTRQYLEKYFQNNDLTIYWGSVDRFMSELQERWSAL